MKLLLSIFAFVLAVQVGAQNDITPQVSKALKEGNATELGKYFASNVDLTLPNDEDMFAKDQAIKLVRGFFASHPSTSFTVKHRGTSKLNDHYRIGELVTSKGKFRVTFFMKTNGNTFQISQFRIEESDED